MISYFFYIVLISMLCTLQAMQNVSLLPIKRELSLSILLEQIPLLPDPIRAQYIATNYGINDEKDQKTIDQKLKDMIVRHSIRDDIALSLEAFLHFFYYPKSSIDVNLEDFKGGVLCLMSKPIEAGNVPLVQLLLTCRGININRNDFSLLDRAMNKNSIPMAKLLLEAGAMEPWHGCAGASHLAKAIAQNKLEFVKLFLPHIDDINAKDYSRTTPLISAIAIDNPEILQLILNHPGVDIHQTDEKGNNALHACVEHHAIRSLTLLQNAGIQYRPNQDGQTPLHTLFKKHRTIPLVEAPTFITPLLLAKQADINALDIDGNTPLIWAVISRSQYIQCIIDSGADIHKKNKYSYNAFHFAAMEGDLPNVRILLGAGARIDERSPSGSTPLFYAVRHDNISVTNYLLSAGADINAQNLENATPIKIAIEANFENMVSQLLAHKDTDIKKAHEYYRYLKYRTCHYGNNYNERRHVLTEVFKKALDKQKVENP
jgi:ankyrin repeat protein